MKNAVMVVGRHIFAFLISKIDEIDLHLKSIFESILRVKQKIRLDRSYPRFPKSYRSAKSFEKFRKYCYYLSNDYIINHDGYDLYYRVMDCYYRWKEEKR